MDALSESCTQKDPFCPGYYTAELGHGGMNIMQHKQTVVQEMESET